MSISTFGGGINLERLPVTNFLNYMFNTQVVVKRRKGWQTGQAPRDVLNAPSYNTPENWETIYSALPCRIEYSTFRSSGKIDFKKTGERISPQVVLFTDNGWDVEPEDRIFENDGSVWIVEGKKTYWNTVGLPHHSEYSLVKP